MIDFEVLKRHLSAYIVPEGKERYVFTWPGKSEAQHEANTSTNHTLRPSRTDSVDFDKTRNIYIEGDNLEALKLLRETYLGTIKMIYIDPPYNTGNDFVYHDNFSMTEEDYSRVSGDFDESGNRLVVNTLNNGRFHTDWLNMMYPRLLLAKDLLADDGAIFISIDENEMTNLRKICDEIFGVSNFRNNILVRRRIKSLNSQFAEAGLHSLNVGYEYVVIYSKGPAFVMNALRMKKTDAPEKGRWDVFWSNADRPTMRYELLGFTPITGQWRNSKEKAIIAVENYRSYEKEYASKMSLEDYWRSTGCKLDFIRRIPNGTGKNGGVQHWVPPSDSTLRTSNWLDIEVSQIGKEIDIPFDNPKSKNLIMELIKLATKDNDIVLDFFSGSATTAHAIYQLNKELGSNRQFILVQIPQKIDNSSEDNQFLTICDIGKERMRQAANLLKSSQKSLLPNNPDYGFRVFKIDSSNMTDVFYNPSSLKKDILDYAAVNIKADRSGEDLLFQVMLELGIELSASIIKNQIDGKEVFIVDDGYLIACFDENVTNELVTEIANKKPKHVVFRDSSLANDSVAINYEQIFKAYSPNTKAKVL